MAEGEQEVTLRFRGTFSGAIQKSAAPTWVAGDQTAGVVGPKGSYLTRGFYAPSSGLCTFRVRIRVPLPHRAVSQGRRTGESENNGVHESVYESDHPRDGLVVVTGPWQMQEREIAGLSCRTYLYEGDEAHAALLFSTLGEEVPRYQALFGGAVPDGRFDVVSNFFATGYGFPNFTLLGQTVIQYVCAKTAAAGQTVLPSGYLDHELVHCWLGNHLQVDYAKGNWCEALTTYFTNYGSALRGGSGGAHRAKVSRSFSLRVTPEKDYPLRAFHAKSHAFENDIGYGKGSMLFDMLARHLEGERFLEAVRHVLANHGGERLGWDELVAALSTGAGTDLKGWFEPWLSRTGGPTLEWGEVKYDGGRVAGTVRQTQEGEAYELRVRVRLHTSEGSSDHFVRSASKESVFSLP
ncbi:MAG: M1 family metallopeptidase, partial [Planctomycetes bacterium]|nr:M1 family metallopeptidase [Planctomycetota bacterium]